MRDSGDEGGDCNALGPNSMGEYPYGAMSRAKVGASRHPSSARSNFQESRAACTVSWFPAARRRQLKS